MGVVSFLAILCAVALLDIFPGFIAQIYAASKPGNEWKAVSSSWMVRNLAQLFVVIVLFVVLALAVKVSR
jgi:hypothetical protein